MYAKELVKLLEQHGWVQVSCSGSHLKMKKGAFMEIVPLHRKELPKGFTLDILKRTGLR